MLTPDSSDTMKEGLTNRTWHVLLVSQNEQTTISLDKFLENSDIKEVSVSRREDAVNCLRQNNFDAVIADICQDPDNGMLLRHDVRMMDEKIPILFMTPLFYYSDMGLLDQVVEDPYSYYIPENADAKFMLSKLHQVIHTHDAENSLEHLQTKVTRNWDMAGLLQKAMLPPWVYFSEQYEFSYLYHPFTKVSGDVFEWLPLDENRALFIFGDISGHGTHSALAMTALQSYLSQVIMLDKDRATRPGQIISDINNFLCLHLHNIVYMSTLIAYIDFKDNFIRYQNAGCMDILCVDADTGEAVDINPEKKGSIPPGMIKNAAYSEENNVEYHFSDSSVFLLCSDGLMDLSKDKAGSLYVDMELYRRLASVLLKDAQKEERSIAHPFRCLHSLEQVGYVHPQDDLSMILIRKPLLQEHEYVFSCRVPADKKAADAICKNASDFVTKFYQDDVLAVSTELLLEEYLVNVIMHGLTEYERLNEYIAIKLCAYEHELKLIIWDHGKEWNGMIMPPENAEEILDRQNETLAESGRGIPIISKIASRISRQRYSGLNETIFFIPYHPEE